MPKKKISTIKKNNVKIINDKKSNSALLQTEDKKYQITRINKDEKNLDENEEVIDDEAIEDEDDYEADDTNDLDDDDKEISVDSDNQEEDETNPKKKFDLQTEKIEQDEDACIYNYVDNESEDEQEDLIFDDDDVVPISDVVPNEQRITRPILTKYERVRILGDRKQQLTLGAKPMIKNIDMLSPGEIAELELKNNVIPLIIERPLPNGKKERWFIKELQH